ncbi:MAG: HepT-like ribonuclease domain-containing protein [Pseudomonadota bacterium]
MQRDASAYLYDIVQAADRIHRFIGQRTFENYTADELVRSGVERQFGIIGEALNHLGQRHKSLLAEIREHPKIIGFRNILIHGYAEIDDAVVWSIVVEKLPLLLEDVIKLLSKLDPTR